MGELEALPTAKEARKAREGEKAKKDLLCRPSSSDNNQANNCNQMPQLAQATRQLVWYFWYLLKDPQTMELVEQEALIKLKSACSELALACELLQELIKMVGAS